MENLPEKYCVTTITCNQFAIGTEVLIYSFLKNNPWFDGDIRVVISDLNLEYRERLSAHYPVQFIKASDDLIDRVDSLRRHFPYLNDIHLRFFSLESFNQIEYDKIVYLDSDMYCAGDIKELFTSQSALLACLDGYSYEDRISPIVQRVGLELPATSERYGKNFTNSFNAGVISITPQKLPAEHYQKMLSMLDFEQWTSYGDSIFTDQMIINRYFEGQIEIISSEYNYMIFLDSYLQFVDHIEPQQARVIHFAGKIKPWNNYSTEDIINLAPHYQAFIQQWRALLDQARNSGDPKYFARKLIEQYQWIERGADHQLQTKGRIY